MVSLPEHLLSEGFNADSVGRAVASSRGLVRELWADGDIDGQVLLANLANYFNLPVLETLLESETGSGLDVAPLTYLKSNGVAPIALDKGRLTVAMSDPTDLPVLNDLKIVFGAIQIDITLASPAKIESALGALYQNYSANASDAMDELDLDDEEMSLNGLAQSADLLDAGDDDAPVVKFVNLMLVEAVKRRASDIHIEPYSDTLKIRYRIDGLLQDIHNPPKKLGTTISSRIKILSVLDIAERRLPQDGRFQIRVANQDIDVRVSVVPTAFGERIVLRLLNKSQSVLTLPELGMAKDIQDVVESIISRTAGIFLVTGPTGSGKTTTLYAALTAINTIDQSIMTVEDPIEYQIAGVGQMHINTKVGLTFATALRSILRHDPDVIMVGEIRDAETAGIAIHASQTGHLVFSTLHTNNAAGAVTRLIDMGIEPFLIASSVSAILAQRLVRRICPHCKVKAEYPQTVLDRLGLVSEDEPFYRGQGCDKCYNSGYLGRAAIFELLPMDDTIRDMIIERSSSVAITEKAVKVGMRTLLQSGAMMVRAGKTTPDEVLRVIHA